MQSLDICQDGVVTGVKVWVVEEICAPDREQIAFKVSQLDLL